MRSLLQRVVASGVVQGHVELIVESGVVSVVVICQRVSRVAALVVACQRVKQGSGPCRGLSESGGAAWNLLQRVE